MQIVGVAPVMFYSDDEKLVAYSKAEQVAYKLSVITNEVLSSMINDQHDPSNEYHFSIEDSSQRNSYCITVGPHPFGPASRCAECEYELCSDQLIKLSIDGVEEETPAPGSRIVLTAHRLHRIISHNEFGANESSQTQLLNLLHQFLYKTGAPQPSTSVSCGFQQQ